MVASAGLRGPFRRILVAVDLSPTSLAVINTALEMAQGDASEVQVVHSEEASKSFWCNLKFWDPHGDLSGDRQRFEGLVRDSGLPGEPSAIVLHGHPGRAVLNQAREWEADLIVMGLRRFNFPFWTRLGRTARYVLRHGDRSIVLVPD
jgi:nucleotide-binding universal stress UspA family protein